MNFLLCIHTTYNKVDCALAHNKEILVESSITKEQASAQLIPTIDALLSVRQLQLSDITHLIVNQGPAPFTTLRTIIATANGIAFANKIPLVGVDGLEAFMAEYSCIYAEPTVALLNAFNKAVYYDTIAQSNRRHIKGYATIEACLDMMKKMFNNQIIHFIGNGSMLYHSEIRSVFGNQAHFQEPLPLTASIEQILKTGIQQIQNNQGITQCIEPLYLKKPLA
jgi:tRNA threonylcarbamoyladenosine biosynthesis protein TsaB